MKLKLLNLGNKFISFRNFLLTNFILLFILDSSGERKVLSLMASLRKSEYNYPLFSNFTTADFNSLNTMSSAAVGPCHIQAVSFYNFFEENDGQILSDNLLSEIQIQCGEHKFKAYPFARYTPETEMFDWLETNEASLILEPLRKASFIGRQPHFNVSSITQVSKRMSGMVLGLQDQPCVLLILPAETHGVSEEYYCLVPISEEMSASFIGEREDLIRSIQEVCDVNWTLDPKIILISILEWAGIPWEENGDSVLAQFSIPFSGTCDEVFSFGPYGLLNVSKPRNAAGNPSGLLN